MNYCPTPNPYIRILIWILAIIVGAAIYLRIKGEDSINLSHLAEVEINISEEEIISSEEIIVLQEEARKIIEESQK